MKQILQNLKSGETLVEDVPCPRCLPGHLLIASEYSLVSAGTERMLVEFGRANLLDKARQQPDKVREVIDKARVDGIGPTIEAVVNKLDQPLPLGYSNVGTVIEVGDGVKGYAVGDRVVSNGYHAEFVCVPKNLCAKVPGAVSSSDAAFTVLGAIALQGIRLLKPTLGESVVVTGLGLIGLLAAQILKAHGCRVLGLDFDAEKVSLAQRLGIEAIDVSKVGDPLAAAEQFSRGQGVDAVLITASTDSNEPIRQAATMCRKRGRIVLVGVVGTQISRADFYEKELSFQVSCSYGPGRYDDEYEEKGNDYPLAYVRWTEQRNFEAILDLIASNAIDVQALVSHSIDFVDASRAYELISGGNPLGILLEYEQKDLQAASDPAKKINMPVPVSAAAAVRVGFIGSGNYATSVLIPAFAKTDAALVSVSCNSGVSGTHVAKKFGIAEVTTDTHALIESPNNNTIVITTRHNNHAELVLKGLDAGKHIFVEKPLVINREQLAKIETRFDEMAQHGGPQLMVGFNRRFSPLVKQAMTLLEVSREPASFIMTVNAGAIPSDHWTQDPDVGGGRIIGEACHFIDLLRFMAGAPIQTTRAMQIGPGCNDGIQNDKTSIMLAFENGSTGVIHYLANGSKSFPKERLEIFCGGGILQLDNFRKMRGYGWPGFRQKSLWRQDKGNRQCVREFVQQIETGGQPLIPFPELVEVANSCFDVMEQLSS